MFEERPGEIRLANDPARLPGDAGLVFIGLVRSPWKTREDCPKNRNAALERGLSAAVEIDPAWRDGLAGLERASHVILLTWLHHAPRDLIVQTPRHAGRPSGVFALRSPARPNPIGLHVARLTSLDRAAGVLAIDAIDVLDGTPVLDVKPYHASVDAIPEATIERT